MSVKAIVINLALWLHNLKLLFKKPGLALSLDYADFETLITLSSLIQVTRALFMRWNIPILLGIASFLAFSEKAIAHGVHIQHHEVSAVQVQATYDSGEPMDNAQVTIYSPEDPSTPWMQGVSDAQGEFMFVPEPGQTGTWTVRIRKAGHGQIFHIASPGASVNGSSTAQNSGSEASPSAIASASLGSYTSLQKGLMLASILWGFVGTALFFSRSNRSKSNAHS
jgi:nickel transport protein